MYDYDLRLLSVTCNNEPKRTQPVVTQLSNMLKSYLTSMKYCFLKRELVFPWIQSKPLLGLILKLNFQSWHKNECFNILASSSSTFFPASSDWSWPGTKEDQRHLKFERRDARKAAGLRLTTDIVEGIIDRRRSNDIRPACLWLFSWKVLFNKTGLIGKVNGNEVFNVSKEYVMDGIPKFRYF